MVFTFSITSYSQSKEKILITNETYCQIVSEKTFKIITTNDKSIKILTGNLKFKSSCFYPKKDRNGSYLEAVFLYPVNEYNYITSLFK